MTETNAAEKRRWNDANWVKVWPKREPMTDSVTPFLLDALALRPGERVLDVGSGGGRTTIAAAAAVAPGGHVVGADLSAGLTELAQQRAAEAGVGNVAFVAADVQEDQVDGAPFDVVMSQFGVMFFDEPETAFANIRAQLDPDGRIAFTCWQTLDRNPWFIGAALADFVPPPPQPGPGKSPTGPFALGDAERTHAILESAGFANISRTAHELLPEVPQDSMIDAAQLRMMGVPEESMDGAVAVMNTHLARFATRPGYVQPPLRFQIFRATAR